jgi:hypothetical protein
MAEENTPTIPADDPEGKLRATLPPQETSQQPDPSLRLTRIGPLGLTLFAVVAIAIITVVLIGLNGANETVPNGNAPAAAAASNNSAPNTPSGPTPTAPQTGPGAKP